jgi:tetratricopeptide (TPR) repeat protein
MRHLFGIVPIIMVAAVFGADVRDLGVPAGWSASDYDRRGYDLLNKHDYENARRYLDAAIRTDPSMWTAYYNRATTFCMQKKWTAALQDLNSTIRLKRNFFQASLTRASVNGKLGNYKASLMELDNLVTFTVEVSNTLEQAEVLNNRAWLRATCPQASIRNGQLAVTDAKKACKLDGWILGSYIDTLAAAYAEAGDFTSAIRYQEQAMVARRATSQQASKTLSKLKYDEELYKRISEGVSEGFRKSLDEMTQRLELYKQHRPYCETASH